jgi:hypothetical protein
VLQAAEKDKPMLRDAEVRFWKLIAKLHNFAFDHKQLTDKDAIKLGKFSADFEMGISYSDAKPLESEMEVINVLKGKKELGLYSRADGLKKLEPNLTEKEIEAKLAEIDEESQARAAAFGTPDAEDDETDDDNEDEKPSPFKQPTAQEESRGA